MLEQVVLLTGLTPEDFSPTSPYYVKMMDAEFGSTTRAVLLSLGDKSRSFNLSDAYELVTYAWARVHPFIAPSERAFHNGTLWMDADRNNVQFYVDDEMYQVEQEYKEQSQIIDASSNLKQLTPTRRYKIARLAGIKIPEGSKDEAVFVKINKWLSEEDARSTDKLKNVRLFNSLCSLADENLEVQFTVHEALAYNIYREAKGGRIYDGQNPEFKDKAEAVEELSNPKNQEKFLALQDRIKSAKMAFSS
jgi:hypothetical protein